MSEAKKPEVKPETKKVKLVKMVRKFEGKGNNTADVHPDNVADYKANGWSEA